jgi:5-methylthioadenosine/S-adenosylhomocysteine deaminase
LTIIQKKLDRKYDFMSITCIRNCDWAIIWDEELNRHRYVHSVDVVFSGNEITHTGSHYTGPVDKEISGSGLMAMPGLINIHSHPSLEPSYKGIREEHGVPEMYMSGLYERCATLMPDQEGQKACTELAYCEMLLSGVTSIADLSFDYPGWKELAERSGLRVWMAPWFSSSSWYVDNRHEVKFNWDEAAGWKAFEKSLALIDSLKEDPISKLSGMVYPAQIDTCTEDLLKASITAATERGITFTTHAAQSVMEFNIMVQRHGKTPIQWADEIGILKSNSIIGHAIFIDEHSWLHWATRKDLEILVKSKASVAHCPTPFARYGHVLEDFGRYKRAGVNLGIGTDTTPHNMIEEMRWAAILGRVAAEDMFSVTTEDIFNAATVDGAAALLRNDIGRLAPGMKADLILVDLTHPNMRPARDPLRSLIYAAADRAVRDVFVDGTQVVADGKVLTMDMEGACNQVELAQKRMVEKVPSIDYAKRTIGELAPLSLLS